MKTTFIMLALTIFSTTMTAQEMAHVMYMDDLQGAYEDIKTLCLELSEEDCDDDTISEALLEFEQESLNLYSYEYRLRFAGFRGFIMTFRDLLIVFSMTTPSQEMDNKEFHMDDITGAMYINDIRGARKDVNVLCSVLEIAEPSCELANSMIKEALLEIEHDKNNRDLDLMELAMQRGAIMAIRDEMIKIYDENR